MAWGLSCGGGGTREDLDDILRDIDPVFDDFVSTTKKFTFQNLETWTLTCTRKGDQEQFVESFTEMTISGSSKMIVIKKMAGLLHAIQKVDCQPLVLRSFLDLL